MFTGLLAKSVIVSEKAQKHLGDYQTHKEDEVNEDEATVVLGVQWGDIVKVSNLVWAEGVPVIFIFHVQLVHMDRILY